MAKKNVYIHWQRVLLFVLLFTIILLLLYAAFFFRSVEKSRTAGFEEAADFVIEESKISEIEAISYFQSDKAYYTFTAKDEKGESYYVFLEDRSSFSTEALFMIPVTSTVPIDQVEAELNSECPSCQLSKASLAMVEQYPLWELTYMDERNRYVIEYKYLENGQTFEKLMLTRKYKKD